MASDNSHNHLGRGDLFASLPDEVIVSIFSSLESLADAIRLASTCKRLCGLADDSLWWRDRAVRRTDDLLLEARPDLYGFDWRWLCRASCVAASLQDRSYGSVVYNRNDDEALYWGEVLDGQPHGYGMLVIGDRGAVKRLASVRGGLEPKAYLPIPYAVHHRWAAVPGDWCQGRWEEGVHRQGHGRLTMMNGRVYQGQLAEGRPHGRGAGIEVDGYRREGEWVDGKFRGGL
ncbi:F-box domain containing protein [Pandoravirus neocaledonia]|uniref:F-box domain containing protein n=1 Tax=Pandoravirus neocaledonia TaxID=2107708 RepID=A0A2U7UDS3_9VIRU|nr:F-box domain containing protein [Pandoravirus neocaledonia]AVK76618.1 F-box domain containing protein [Pandoravirus neocaledonia]